MNVLLFSRYGRLAPSSRLRSYQYVPYFESSGIRLTISPLLDDSYVASLYGKSTTRRSITGQYIDRFRAVTSASRYDAIWVEKETFPWLPAWIELNILPARVPLLVDYDDAVFHRYDRHTSVAIRCVLGKKIDALMKRANVVTVGNDYLAERAHYAGAKNIVMLPTVVDTMRYQARFGHRHQRPVTVGWIGSPVTARHLQLIGDVIKEVKSRFRENVQFVAIGANRDQLANLDVTVRDWVEDCEAQDVGEFDIGIMPLPDEPFERGKCGYKLIQYMACGKPVVASPIGINQKIVEDGISGFLARTTVEWIDAISNLVDNPALRERLGRAARTRVEADYSLQKVAPRLVQVFQEMIA